MNKIPRAEQINTDGGGGVYVGMGSCGDGFQTHSFIVVTARGTVPSAVL